VSRPRRERRRKERIARRLARSSAPASSVRSTSHRLIVLATAFILGAAVAYSIARYQARSAVNPSSQRISTVHAGLTLGRLVEMSSDELADVDIAEANLLCAKDLPGSQDLDIQKALKIIDYWTDRVDLETKRNRHRFKEHPEQYENSEIYYLMGMIVTVLQQDLGVRYDPALTDSDNLNDEAFLSDPSNVFLTGLLSEKRAGTCASMPVLYVAIGRRLGYPVSLVNAKDHLFVRWQRPGEDAYRDLEATSQGVVFKTDDDYKTWRKIPEDEIKSGVSLRTLTPEQTLAIFMQTRAGALQFHKRLPEAIVAYAEAARLWPEAKALKTYLADAVVKLAPWEFSSAAEERKPLSSKEMIEQANRRMLKEQHPEIDWDSVEQKNHLAPKKP
jgi:regulator of sirC expression with transglutaminase-like and TPR domain